MVQSWGFLCEKRGSHCLKTDATGPGYPGTDTQRLISSWGAARCSTSSKRLLTQVGLSPAPLRGLLKYPRGGEAAHHVLVAGAVLEGVDPAMKWPMLEIITSTPPAW